MPMIKTPRQRGEEAMEELKKLLLDYPVNTTVLQSAFKYAAKVYCDKDFSVRISFTEEHYLVHAVNSAKRLIGNDTIVLSVALLHDLLEADQVRVDRKRNAKFPDGLNYSELDNIFETPVISETLTIVMEMKGRLYSSDIQENTIIDEQMISTDAQDILTKKMCYKRAVLVVCAEAIDEFEIIQRAINNSVHEGKRHILQEKLRDKVKRIRALLLPAARELKINRMADELEKKCQDIEPFPLYTAISERYEALLEQRKDVFWGSQFSRNLVPGAVSFIEGLPYQECFSAKSASEKPIKVEVRKRYVSDLLREELHGISDDCCEIEKSVEKQTVSLYDIFFLTDDSSDRTPESIFFCCYEALHSSRFRFTITAINRTRDAGLLFYKVADKYQNTYRLFILSEKEYQQKILGAVQSEEEKIWSAIGEKNKEEITIYRRDDSPVRVEKGNALDIAFAIGKNIALCAYGVEINGVDKEFGTEVLAGDKVVIKTDHYGSDSSLNKFHANVRWFQYLQTKKARVMLANWLAANSEIASPYLDILDAKGKKYQIKNGSTILDAAFLFDSQKVMQYHLNGAYVDKDLKATILSKKIKAGDRITFDYDVEKRSEPPFEWLRIVKTEEARDILFHYFDEKYNK